MKTLISDLTFYKLRVQIVKFCVVHIINLLPWPKMKLFFH